MTLLLLATHAGAQASSDATAIRRARLEQNRAIVANDIERVASFWTEDVILRRGLGQAVIGRDAYRRLFSQAQTDSALIYQREPASIEVSPQWPLAFESGVWSARLGTVSGPQVITGRYSAQWVKRDASWLIRAEVFVALTCSGSGCSAQAFAGPARLLLTDSTHHVDLLAREPMVAEDPRGALFLTGYSDPSPKLWKSMDRGATWTRVSLGDSARGNSDVDLAIAPDGTIYFASMSFDRSVGEGRRISMGVSTDAGATWRWVTLAEKRFVDRPWVEVAADGTACAIWNDDEGVWYSASRDRGVTWPKPVRISARGGSSHLALGPRGEIAVRVAPIAASGNKLDEGVDRVGISADGGATWTWRDAPGERDWPSASSRKPTQPRWVEPVAWDSTGALFSFWTNARGIWLARSRDAGASWSMWRLAEPAVASYYPYLIARSDGQLAATWFSGVSESLRVHVARIDASSDAPTMIETDVIRPESRGLTSRREDPATRSTAGEYVPVVFLSDGSIGVASAIQDERAARFGFTWWRLQQH